MIKGYLSESAIKEIMNSLRLVHDGKEVVWIDMDGVVTPQWVKITGKKIMKRSLSRTMLSFLTGRQEFEKVLSDDMTIFEGNALRNIDPYKYLPDPSVPVHGVQKGEFVGWLDESRYINLLEREYNQKDMFNVRYVEMVTNRFSSVYTSVDRSGRNEKSGVVRVNDAVLKPVDVLYMYVNLIPREWNLPGERPEKWLFALASDEAVS